MATPAAFFAAIVPVACGAPSTTVHRDALDQPAVVTLPAGTVLRLLPLRGSPPGDIDAIVAMAWFREALRQSSALDIAAGPVAGPPRGDGLALSFDATRAHAAVDLCRPHDERRLASVPLADRPLHVALDELAARTRSALGEPLDAAPAPVSRIYSADAEVVLASEAALEDIRLGDHAVAIRRLTAVRRRDGAAAFLLEALASSLSMQGDAEQARRIAEEALQIEARRGPTTTHRLLRTLLLARATLEPDQSARFDQDLCTLGEVALRERPHDPECALTAAMALNFLGRFADALPRLQALCERLPDHAGVSYHLGWAALGVCDTATAIAAFDRSAARLPIGATVVPRAIARFVGGDLADLRRFLATVADLPLVRSGAALHEVRRMQIALELLAGDFVAATALAEEDLDWLLAHPNVLETRAGELVDLAVVLVEIRHGEHLLPHLADIERRWPDGVLADAALFARSLIEAQQQGGRATAAEAVLAERGRGCWSESLAAFGHRGAGQRADERTALGRAVRLSGSPLLTAACIDNLEALARTEEAEHLRAALRRELGAVDLRRRSQSPILGPELAWAWRTASGATPQPGQQLSR